MTTTETLRGLLREATQGPWHDAASGIGLHDIDDQDGRLLARMWGEKGHYPLPQFEHNSYLTFDEHKANAALIVAAINALPSLLDRLEKAEAALREIVARVDNGALLDFDDPEIDAARSALAEMEKGNG